MARLDEIEAFCLTVERGNFTRAAKALGVTPQAASRAVGRLEERLGVELLRRNTRHVAVSTHGRQYYDACRRALDLLGDAEARLGTAAGVVAGAVRISVPTTYGHHRFLPLLVGFRRRFPAVRLEVQVDNRNVDFVRDGFDLAVRMGTLDDGGFIARRLGDFDLGVFASPDYLARRGTPTTPDGLMAHDCAVFVMPRTGRALPWTFVPGPEALAPPAALRVRQDILGIVTFARSGGGIIQTYRFMVEAELARGELVEILSDFAGRARPFSLIYPREAAARPPVRALIDYVLDATRGDRNSG